MPVHAILSRERILIGICLTLTVALAWIYLLDMARDMSNMEAGMSSMVMPSAAEWNLVDLFSLFIMWTVMMVAMMVPSAAPAILTFLFLNQRRREAARPFVSTYVFVFGYVLAWTLYSALATLAQWGLHEAALISAAMVVTNVYVNGFLLIAAGLFQWTPLKRKCLVGCRSPLSFLMSRWREGRLGALVMGLEHGSYCVGCCWVLMTLLFVTGVMNLLWVAVIACFVIAEKLLPHGELVGRIAGVILVGIGLTLMTQSGF